jgi:hypothetical protein
LADIYIKYIKNHKNSLSSSLSPPFQHSKNLEFIKATAMGISVLVASGDTRTRNLYRNYSDYFGPYSPNYFASSMKRKNFLLLLFCIYSSKIRFAEVQVSHMPNFCFFFLFLFLLGPWVNTTILQGMFQDTVRYSFTAYLYILLWHFYFHEKTASINLHKF